MNIELTVSLSSELTASTKSIKSLCTLLSRAQISAALHEQSEVFGFKSRNLISTTAVEAAGLQLEGAYENWLRADPVHIVTDQHAAVISEVVTLDDNEITSLLLDINQLLIEDEHALYAPQSNAWYLNTSDTLRISTLAVSEMIGRNILEGLPTGDAQIKWRRLFTEIQMLLHTHSVNAARRQQQLPTVDALWFWGQGTTPRDLETVWYHVWADNILIDGLSYLTDCPLSPVAKDFSECEALMHEGKYLIILDKITDSIILENNWAQPILQALKKHKIKRVQFLFNKKIYETSTKHVKKWWQPIKKWDVIRNKK